MITSPRRNVGGPLLAPGVAKVGVRKIRGCGANRGPKKRIVGKPAKCLARS